MKSILVTIFGYVLAGSFFSCQAPAKKAVVIQSDFGIKDGAVAEMKGVIMNVDPTLRIFDLTHEIPAYNIWEAAFRLNQTAPYWPPGTIFVSVVDPGVGTERKSVVLKTRSGHYFVSPDNGTLTLVSETLGIESVYEIDETINRRPGSEKSYTFHGRDVYAYTAAKLAEGVITLEQVGKKLPDEVVKITSQKAILKNDSLFGNIPILDIQYGNVWTNIDDSLTRKWQLTYGDSVKVLIWEGSLERYQEILPFVSTFGQVESGKPLAYMNSLMNLSLAINQGNFSDSFHVYSGPQWTIALVKNK